MRKIQGFTLIELMVTIAVLAIIAMMAAPTFTQMIRNNQLNNDTGNLVTLLLEARSTAVIKQKDESVILSGANAWSPSSEAIKWATGQPTQTTLTYNMMGYLAATSNVCLVLEHANDAGMRSVVLVRRNGSVIYDKKLSACPNNLGNE